MKKILHYGLIGAIMLFAVCSDKCLTNSIVCGFTTPFLCPLKCFVPCPSINRTMYLDRTISLALHTHCTFTGCACDVHSVNIYCRVCTAHTTVLLLLTTTMVCALAESAHGPRTLVTDKVPPFGSTECTHCTGTAVSCINARSVLGDYLECCTLHSIQLVFLWPVVHHLETGQTRNCACSSIAGVSMRPMTDENVQLKSENIQRYSFRSEYSVFTLCTLIENELTETTQLVWFERVHIHYSYHPTSRLQNL